MPDAGSFALEPRTVPAHAGVSLEATANGQILGRRAFFEALRDEPAMRATMSDTLRALGMTAMAWETAPLSRANAERPMVQLVLPHPALARAEPDRRPFDEHIAKGAGSEGIVWFENFGHDARLVVPCAPSPQSPFGHLVTFLASASASQRDALWQVVGQLACDHLARTDAPVWVSTAGMAVSWLHVRLDLRPKYYRTDALRSPDA